MLQTAGYGPRVSGDVLTNVYEVEIAGKSFLVRRLNDRIEFLNRGEEEPFGLIVFGGPQSGAIWLNENFIGEYEVIDKKSIITPVENGRRNIDATSEGDPITYLLERVPD
jgi:hypothetical protein